VRHAGRAFLAGLALLLLSAVPVAARDDLAVEMVNQSEPMPCAEKDNVAIALSSASVTRFRIEAVHPAYIGTLRRDTNAPDWTACDMSGDPAFAAPAPPRRVVLYDGPRLRVVGFVFARFWRPATAAVRVGARVESSLHLIQLWVPSAKDWEEVLVLYPQDGYWRARPLTPTGLRSTAYGSSFLIGPIEQAGRPLVAIREAVIDPAGRTVSLAFARGGSATLTIAAIDQAHIALDVALAPPVAGGPFAMLRSMYVTETNNDVARVAVREEGAPGWRESAVMAFDKARATELWAGRATPSRHNTSAPDMLFRGFSDGK
jgi:hypothetical protein